MPVGVKLKGSRGLNDSEVVARPSHELQSNGKTLIGESAGNRKSRKSAKIADCTERIGKSEIGLEVCLQWACGDWL